MVGERQVPGAVHRPAGRPDPPAGEGSATGRRRPLRGDGAGQSSLPWSQLPAPGPPPPRQRRDKVRYTVADPGSGAFLTLDHKTHIFYSFMTNFWVKSTLILSVLAKKCLYLFKNKIINNFCDICGYKNGRTKKFPFVQALVWYFYVYILLRSSISGASLCVTNRRLFDAGNPRSVIGKIVRRRRQVE